MGGVVGGFYAGGGGGAATPGGSCCSLALGGAVEDGVKPLEGFGRAHAAEGGEGKGEVFAAEFKGAREVLPGFLGSPGGEDGGGVGGRRRQCCLHTHGPTTRWRERTHLHDKRIRLPDARGAWRGEYIPTDSPPQRSSNNPHGRT
jgi:hypothetical protein